jgi:O-antigen/teichoic acid export membrane protein
VYLVYAVPCLAILGWAPEICSFVFGAAWQEAGQYAQILVFSSFISVGKIPYIALIKIFRVQGASVLLDISALVAQVVVFLIFVGDVDALGAIKSFAFVFASYNIAVMIWMARTAMLYDKSLELQH